MSIYFGVDFHPRQQTICYCDTANGEVQRQELYHERDDDRGFYARFAGEVIVGLEASGYSTWFEQMLEKLGHEVRLGNAAEVRRRARRRQKNDRRDAELILDLLLKGEFPLLHRPPSESCEVLRLLRYRHRLMQMRTMAKNSLQALALSAGLVNRGWLFGKQGRERLMGLPMSAAMSRQRDGWLELLADLGKRVRRLDGELQRQAQ